MQKSVQYNGGLCSDALLVTALYEEELTSVYICYSQGNGFNTLLSIFYILYTQVCSVVVLLVFRCWSMSRTNFGLR